MRVDWHLRESGPADAEHTVLLLPGGLCGAGSYAELMAQPALARTRLIAATLPGHAGAPPPGDYSIETYAQLAAELAARADADVVVGFSLGASVALEMVASGGFTGRTVLLGISLSAADEPAFFHANVGLGSVLGGLPAATLAKGAASMVKKVPVSPERQVELRDDLRRNVPGHVRRSLREYRRWLCRPGSHAERMCRAGSATWIVPAEKGDGGLTGDQRRVIQGCHQAHLVTIPGAAFLLPAEVPEQIAEVIIESLPSSAAARSPESGVPRTARIARS
jgi:pimeloyl-ACP methyl ester carboxylesterase